MLCQGLPPQSWVEWGIRRLTLPRFLAAQVCRDITISIAVHLKAGSRLRDGEQTCSVPFSKHLLSWAMWGTWRWARPSSGSEKLQPGRTM